MAAGTLSAAAATCDIQGRACFCRVLASAKPTSDSDIRIEVWLPVAGWNGELRGYGNGLLEVGQAQIRSSSRTD